MTDFQNPKEMNNSQLIAWLYETLVTNEWFIIACDKNAREKMLELQQRYFRPGTENEAGLKMLVPSTCPAKSFLGFFAVSKWRIKAARLNEMLSLNPPVAEERPTMVALHANDNTEVADYIGWVADQLALYHTNTGRLT